MVFSKLLKGVNMPVFFVLIVYPFFLITLGGLYLSSNSLGAFEIASFITAYYLSNITVGVGLHRLWSHNSYKINKYAEFVLVILSAGTLQGPALAWASDHHKHHTHTDDEGDPHSPLKYNGGVKGFFWSHMGWMLFGEPSYKSISKVTMLKLGRNKLLRWQLRYYWQLATFANLIMPMIIGYMIGGTLAAAYGCFLFAGLGRALQQQITFCVNSACHFWGSKKYGPGTAGDIWWLFMFLLGENWHNFHHAFPSDYRNGVKWYHLDIHKWIIFGMSKIGIAYDLKRTSEVRIKAKVENTLAFNAKAKITKIDALQEKVEELLEKIGSKDFLKVASSSESVQQLLKSAQDVRTRLSQSAQILKESIDDIKAKNMEKILKMSSSTIKQAERNILELKQTFDQALALA